MLLRCLKVAIIDESFTKKENGNKTQPSFRSAARASAAT
jgi:hypothetical protein